VRSAPSLIEFITGGLSARPRGAKIVLPRLSKSPDWLRCGDIAIQETLTIVFRAVDLRTGQRCSAAHDVMNLA
jgi:hypothetical protein